MGLCGSGGSDIDTTNSLKTLRAESAEEMTRRQLVRDQWANHKPGMVARAVKGQQELRWGGWS